MTPFLDLKFSRYSSNSMNFNIYSKSINADKYIVADSMALRPHKTGSLHFFVSRLFSIPWNKKKIAW